MDKNQKILSEIQKLAGDIEFGEFTIEFTVSRGRVAKILVVDNRKSVLIE